MVTIVWSFLVITNAVTTINDWSQVSILSADIYFQKKKYSQVYLVWAPKLDVPITVIPLSKWTKIPLIVFQEFSFIGNNLQRLF